MGVFYVQFSWLFSMIAFQIKIGFNDVIIGMVNLSVKLNKKYGLKMQLQIH